MVYIIIMFLKMIRVLVGFVLGVYAAQNYEVPDAKTYINLVSLYLKDIEKNLQEKSKK